MIDFIPEKTTENVLVPYFEDVKKEDGWAGHTSTKKVAVLEEEMLTALRRLGANVVRMVKGTYNDNGRERQGYRIYFTLQRDDGTYQDGRIDIAALPVRKKYSYNKHNYSYGSQDSSLRMALYMMRDVFRAMWYLPRLSPGANTLLPFLLIPGTNRTVTELYAESGVYSKMLPSPHADFIEGEIVAE